MPDKKKKVKAKGEIEPKKDNWIKEATKNKGALHRALHVPIDEKIGMAKIKKAENSGNMKIKKEAILAETLSKLRKKKK
jgi:hypothetical protein